jgi:hypothetical protein
MQSCSLQERSEGPPFLAKIGGAKVLAHNLGTTKKPTPFSPSILITTSITIIITKRNTPSLNDISVEFASCLCGVR